MQEEEKQELSDEIINICNGKITDLYSDNKVQKVDQKTEMKISWGTDEDLIDVDAEDIPTSTPGKS